MRLDGGNSDQTALGRERSSRAEAGDFDPLSALRASDPTVREGRIGGIESAGEAVV